MATTGTYNFFPSTGEIVLMAYGRLQLRRSELTQQHMIDAFNEANFLQVEFSNRQPNLFVSSLTEIELVPEQATYTLDPTLICFMAVFLRTNDDNGTPIDRILSPLSTYEYAALPNKTVMAPPNQYWFNRQITPEITLWPVPDETQSYTLVLRYLRQIEDASLVNGTMPQIPYRWIDAFVAGLAARLAQIYAPEKAQVLDAKAERAWLIAAKEDTEDVPIFVQPQLSYYSGGY